MTQRRSHHIDEVASAHKGLASVVVIVILTYRLKTVFLLDDGNIVGRVDPLFDETARPAQIARHLDRTKNGRSDADVISGSERASVAGNASDVGGLALWACLRIFHLVPGRSKRLVRSVCNRAR